MVSFKLPRRRLRTPTVLQMEAAECGAAALASVLAYYGRFVTLERLRVDCGVSRDGSKASNVLKAARKYGLTANGYQRKKPESLMKFPLPQILFWGLDHFVVLEGHDSRWFYLNDPAVGPRKVTHEEFNSQYAGIVLVMEPGAEFERGGTRRSPWKSLAARARGSLSGIAFIFCLGLLLVVPGLLTPAFTQIFVDDVLGQKMHHWLPWLLAAMAFTGAVTWLLVFLQKYFLARLHITLSSSMSGGFFWHLLRLPLEFYSQRYAGEMAVRLGLNSRVAGVVTGQLASAGISTVMVLFYLPMMLLYDISLTLIAVAMALINLATLQYVSRSRKDSNARLLQEEGKLSATTMSGIQGIETLKATGREDDFFTKWAGYLAKYINAQQEMTVQNQVMSAVPSTFSNLGRFAILCLGGLKVMNGDMTLGMLMAFQSLTQQFLGPITTLVGLGATMQQVEGDLYRLDDVLNYPVPASEPTPLPDSSGKLVGRLEFREVSFGYAPLSPPLIENFSLTLAPGRRVALVGSTGSGKSTLAKMACGLYSPLSGEILYDGIPLHSIPRAQLTASLSLVDQDIVLFAGTVRDNLTLWDHGIRNKDLVRALRDAGIDEVVMSRPGALDSPLNERGANFSGGERQRLEIARALAKNPTVLIMDEATSALDPLMEKWIDGNIRARGCTCLIVAHRLSTIRDCDEILVLDKGKVVQRGKHHDLVGQEGPYRRLVAAEPGAVP